MVESLERRELLAVGAADTIIDLQGTDGDDTFEFAPGQTAGTWRVTLNGAETEYHADQIHVKFDGGGGDDSCTLLGSELDDTVTLSPGAGAMVSQAYTVEVSQVEKITADAAGGANEGRLYDGAGEDRLDASPGLATLSGDGFENTIVSAAQLRAYGDAGGKDIAYLHDDPGGADRFLSGPGWAKFFGKDFQTRTFGFSRVQAYATSGSDDKAVIEGTEGSRDTVRVLPDVVKFNGSGGARRLFGFAEVRADSAVGDKDKVKIYGDPRAAETVTTAGSHVEVQGGDTLLRTYYFYDSRLYSDDGVNDTLVLGGVSGESDRYVLSPKYSKSVGNGYSVRAWDFDRISAEAEAGLAERADFNGLAGQVDTFSASSDSAKLSGHGYDCLADGFATVYAFATRGDGDKARLFADPNEDEYFEADPKVGLLRSQQSHIQVRHFGLVNAYADGSSTDTVVMFTAEDSVNEFVGTPTISSLQGDDFRHQAIGFRNVSAYATVELRHLATLEDGVGNDRFVATSEYGELSGPGYMTRVVTFHSVQVDAKSGGNDQAILYDSDGVDHLEASHSFARVTHRGAPRNFTVETNGFEQVQLSSSNDDDIKDVVPGSVQWVDPTAGKMAVDTRGADEVYGPSPYPDAPPNVLFIAVDDLNDWVGALGGYAAVQTPNLDRLAQRGVTFSAAYCAAPYCNPSRSAVMTGYYPTTTGVYKNFEDWRVAVPDAVTLPELFKENGYYTVGGGKIAHWNDRADWDEYFPRIPNPEPTAEVRQSEDNNTGILQWGAVDVPDEEMSDYRITSWAADFLLQQHDSPFFLGCGVFRPHIPLDVPQAYFDMYPLDEIQLPETLEGDLDDIPAEARGIVEWDSLHSDLLEADNRERVVQAYLASVSFADAQIGRVLDALESSDYADNTIVMLWSDHGMHFGEKNHWKKGTLWEEATRVPLIVAGPGVAEPGSVCEYPVDLVNLYPTLADLCNLPMDESLDGVSLRPLLQDPDAPWDRPALMNHRDAMAVRYGDWRYIRYGDGSEELYDHGTDPNEWTNLAGNQAYDAIKAELAAMLPETLALEVPKRDYSALHWDTVLAEAVPDPIVSGKRLFYSDFDPETGRELWFTDGNSAPAVVADIHSGARSSNPNELTDCSGIVYFTADDGVHGSELWRSDGTESGTWMVRDIRSGPESSSIGELVQAGDMLLFRADDGTHGVELWCSDGTAEGTTLLQDILPGVSGSYPTELTAVGSTVFFRAYQTPSGAELWKSDGTTDGTQIVGDIRVGEASSVPSELTAAADGLYFQATDGVHGRELWHTTGTATSTRLVADLQPGELDSAPEQLVFAEDALYFVADGSAGRALWRRQSSAPVALLHDALGAYVTPGIGQLTPVGSVVYFQATDAEHGSELWQTDGTASGTRMIVDLLPGSGGSAPSSLTVMGDQLVFAAIDDAYGREFWTTDGTAPGTAILADVFAGVAGSDPRHIRLMEEIVVAFATDGQSPYQLWRIDEGGASRVADLNP